MEIIESANATALRLDGDRLTGLELGLKDGGSRVLDVDHLLVFFGLSPKLGPIADWQLALEHNQIAIDASTTVAALMTRSPA